MAKVTCSRGPLPPATFTLELSTEEARAVLKALGADTGKMAEIRSSNSAVYAPLQLLEVALRGEGC